MTGIEEKSVKDITGRDVFIGDKVVLPFKKMDYIYYRKVRKAMFEVTGIIVEKGESKGIRIKAYADKDIRCCTSFVKVESRNDRREDL